MFLNVLAQSVIIYRVLHMSYSQKIKAHCLQRAKKKSITKRKKKLLPSRSPRLAEAFYLACVVRRELKGKKKEISLGYERREREQAKIKET